MLDKYLQPKPAFLFLLFMAALQYLMFCKLVFWPTEDFVNGGDFVVFWPAARAMLDGNMIELYIGNGMYEAMELYHPDGAMERLTWQYPPHAGFLFSPVGLAPFQVAYGLWFAAGLFCLAGALTIAGVGKRSIGVVLLTSPVFLAFLTGQIALFITSLMLVAVFWAKARPILAGVAAAVLTIKPQLGIFLPLVFIAGGHWRAFASAAFFSVCLWLGSVAVFGIETWMAFFERLLVVSDLVSEGAMPYQKMLNIHAAAGFAMLPELIAYGLTGIAALAGAFAVFWTCRNTDDPRWRYAVLAAATLIVTPYSWYYELALVLPGIWFVLEHGYKKGWLPYERETVALLAVMAVSLPGPVYPFGVSLPFAIMVCACVIIARRVRAELSSDLDRSAPPTTADPLAYQPS